MASTCTSRSGGTCTASRPEQDGALAHAPAARGVLYGGMSGEDPLVGAVLDGAFRLTRVIYSGGMGTVYEAEQLRLSRRVAVKVMVPELAENAEALARFRREV